MPHTSASMLEFHCPGKVSRVEKEEINLSSLERNPGLRRPISEYPIEQCDKVRRAYIMAGPYQPRLGKYPLSGVANHLRSFQDSWYGKFSSWLEYSTDKDATYCLPCCVFSNILSNRFGMNAFTEIGFRNWKKINDGNKCAFLKHIGTSSSSLHNQCVRACDDLMAQSQHIDKILHKQSAKMIVENRLRLKTSIDAIRWLTFQACVLRGNDESIDSLNRVQDRPIRMTRILDEFIDKRPRVLPSQTDLNNVLLATSPPESGLIHESFRIRSARLCFACGSSRVFSRWFLYLKFGKGLVHSGCLSCFCILTTDSTFLDTPSSFICLRFGLLLSLILFTYNLLFRLGFWQVALFLTVGPYLFCSVRNRDFAKFARPRVGRSINLMSYFSESDSMEDEISRMGRILLSNLEKQEIVIPEGVWNTGSNPFDKVVVGHLLSGTRYNFAAFKETMLNAFKPSKRVDFEKMDNGRFFLNFERQFDLDRVMGGGPWCYDNDLLVLKLLQENDNPLSVPLLWVDFYVLAKGLPLSKLNEDMATFISNSLGSFRSVDLARNGVSREGGLPFVYEFLLMSINLSVVFRVLRRGLDAFSPHHLSPSHSSQVASWRKQGVHSHSRPSLPRKNHDYRPRSFETSKKMGPSISPNKSCSDPQSSKGPDEGNASPFAIAMVWDKGGPSGVSPPNDQNALTVGTIVPMIVSPSKVVNQPDSDTIFSSPCANPVQAYTIQSLSGETQSIQVVVQSRHPPTSQWRLFQEQGGDAYHNDEPNLPPSFPYPY
ncbi:hypothetical protein BUALT_Bualt15G0104900 [Buddleja alternifolia]|uniref:TTF-type domain-containing protein n=1 Tax=Buddleja alternifolia TaxID=168488 RepID=A0AAV6WN71_9LAMI|nr:hypothetical protein BUALT_Bualt15G0104900 [Buddleja alternifolia]